jgi:uncharacterized Zn finger protein
MYLRKHLSQYFSSAVRSRGSDLFFWRKITILTGDREQVTAHAEGTQLYFVRLTREGQELHVYCECPYFDSDGPCKHLWATILAAEAKNYLLGLTGKLKLEMDSDDDFDPSSFDLLPTPLQ